MKEEYVGDWREEGRLEGGRKIEGRGEIGTKEA
jgi:hypothetical protein